MAKMVKHLEIIQQFFCHRDEQFITFPMAKIAKIVDEFVAIYPRNSQKWLTKMAMTPPPPPTVHCSDIRTQTDLKHDIVSNN